jgi:uncharacterized membrane protein
VEKTTYSGARAVVTTGILSAIAILLGLTQWGFIPFPTGVQATILHIPAIIGGIVVGWPGGALIGLIFGVFSFLWSTVPLFKDPLVSIVPRVFIGITAYLAYVGLRRFNDTVALTVSAVVGTLTNSLLVLGMAVLRQYMPPELALTILIGNGIPECIVAAIIVVAVVKALKATRGGAVRKAKL